jgi:hypothetical protein
VLLELGFSQDSDGVLRAPDGTTVTVIPVNRFLQLKIEPPSGAALTCTIAKIALKVEAKP